MTGTHRCDSLCCVLCVHAVHAAVGRKLKVHSVVATAHRALVLVSGLMLLRAAVGSPDTSLTRNAKAPRPRVPTVERSCASRCASRFVC